MVTFKRSGKGWVGVRHGETGGKKTLGEVREGCDAGRGGGQGWGDKTGEVGGSAVKPWGSGPAFYPRGNSGSTERFAEGRW